MYKHIYTPGPHKDIRQRNDQNCKFVYLVDKDTICLWRIGKTKRFELGVLTW